MSKKNVTDMYVAENYKKSGVYVNTDEFGAESVVVVNKEVSYPTVWNLGLAEDYLHIFEGKKESTISDEATVVDQESP